MLLPLNKTSPNMKPPQYTGLLPT